MKITKKEFESAVVLINKYKEQLGQEIATVKEEIYNAGLPLDTSLGDSNMSSRLYYLLFLHYNGGHSICGRLSEFREFREMPISSLLDVSIIGFSKIRGVGKKAIIELKEFCFRNNIKLKI